MGRVMIAGTASGCGKTTIVCGILQALVNRKKKVVSFKCGPDYIDPMFHSKIIGTKSRNLDGFFMDKHTMNYLLYRNSKGYDISVIEGVMGYYDGVLMQDTASSYAVGRDTQTPVVLVVPCKGMSRSIQALLSGYLDYAHPSNIKGVIFNQLPASLYPDMKKYCEKRGIKALGYFPTIKEAKISSRYLGLVTADEIVDLKEKMELLATAVEEYIDVDELLTISEQAVEIESNYQVMEFPKYKRRDRPLRIGIARDLAFCFYYEDNLELLRQLGCDTVFFSPINDKHLPENLDGLIFGGGYPELYLKQLSDNKTMRKDIKEAIESEVPVHAECGGFMYMHRFIKNREGIRFPVVGAFNGECYYTEKLQHFGYVTLTAQKDNVLGKKGTKLPAHEFHRFESDVEQTTFIAKKANREWNCMAEEFQMIAGFPHIHYYADLSVATHFYECAAQYRESIKKTTNIKEVKE